MRESERIQHSVTTIATPIVRSLDLELVDVECTGQGSRTLVRVFIDKQNGVTVSDCEQVHLSLSHVVVYEGKLNSLRRFKDDVREVQQGYECGIGVENFSDLKPNDILEVYTVDKVAAKL